MKDIHHVIKTIHLTEKAALLRETANAHVFKVDRKANKLEIKEAIERAFNVKVASVNTANYRGKLKRQRRSDAGRTAHWKKAVVTLAGGESLDLV